MKSSLFSAILVVFSASFSNASTHGQTWKTLSACGFSWVNDQSQTQQGAVIYDSYPGNTHAWGFARYFDIAVQQNLSAIDPALIAREINLSGATIQVLFRTDQSFQDFLAVPANAELFSKTGIDLSLVNFMRLSKSGIGQGFDLVNFYSLSDDPYPSAAENISGREGGFGGWVNLPDGTSQICEPIPGW